MDLGPCKSKSDGGEGEELWNLRVHLSLVEASTMSTRRKEWAG